MEQCSVPSSPVIMDTTESICDSRSSSSRSRNSSTSSRNSFSDCSSHSSGTSIDQATDSDLPSPLIMNDAKQTSEIVTSSNGGCSTLSPFAEPFLPRFSSSSSSSTLSGVAKTNNNNDDAALKSSCTQDTRLLQQKAQPLNTTTDNWGRSKKTTASEDDKVPTAQTLGRQGRPRDASRQEGTRHHQRADAGSDPGSEASAENSGTSGDVNSAHPQFLPSSSTLCGFPVGYEREQSKLRTVSQSAHDDFSNSDSVSNGAVIGEEYSMFGGSSFVDDLYGNLLCASESEDGTAASLAVGSFFSFPFRQLTESRFLSRFQARDDADGALEEEVPLEKRPPRRAFSCADDDTAGPTCEKGGVLRRSLSVPDKLLLKIDDDKTDHETQPRSIQRSKSSASLHSEGRDDEAFARAEENMKTEEKNSFSGNGSGGEIKQRAQADSVLDENGNVSTQLEDKGWPVVNVDASGVSMAEKRAARDSGKEQLVGTRLSVSSSHSVRRSGDSGFGSVSDEPPCLVEMPELKADRSGAWDEATAVAAARSCGDSGQGSRLCPTHDQQLAMYCTDCCLTICTLCFTDRHLGCDRVLTTSLACKDLRWRLLQMQTTLGGHIHSLESQVHQLKPQVRSVKQEKEESKVALNSQLEKVLKQVHAQHEQALKDLDVQFTTRETQTKDSILKAEKTLLLLNYVSKFLEVLRQRDSGWELLSTYDQRLSHLLRTAVQLGEMSRKSVDPPLKNVDQDFHFLPACQRTAFSVAMDVLDGDDGEAGSEYHSDSASPRSGEDRSGHAEVPEHSWANTWVNNLNDIDWSSSLKNKSKGLWGDNFLGEKSIISNGLTDDNSVWTTLFSGIVPNNTNKRFAVDNENTVGWFTETLLQSRDQDNNNNNNNKFRGVPSAFVTKQPAQPDISMVTTDGEKLLREIFGYMQRFPPPSAFSSSSARPPQLHLPSRPSLYDDVMETCSLSSPTDLIDDVFHFDDLTKPPSSSSSSSPSPDIYQSPETAAGPAYVLERRLCPHFPQDVEKTFVADMHLTETGRLVLLDAANQCLKCFDHRQPGVVPRHLPVTKPLSLCSAGWDRVMVSCAERTLAVYSVGRSDFQQVVTRCTRQQYRGVVRASDSLVAAACPETHSVDLLDLAGRVLRSIMPVDFARGPEVVGVTSRGQLLVVYQPVTPPTCIVCFDMAGAVLWTHALPAATRHVSCSKVVGGSDGRVYYALQGDSMVYSLCPDTGEQIALLTTRKGIQFPSCITVNEYGQLLVCRNELPSGPFILTARQPAPLPATTEIDVFRLESPTAATATVDSSAKPEP